VELLRRSAEWIGSTCSSSVFEGEGGQVRAFVGAREESLWKCARDLGRRDRLAEGKE
jgi:hypothetical protein